MAHIDSVVIRSLRCIDHESAVHIGVYEPPHVNRVDKFNHDK